MQLKFGKTGAVVSIFFTLLLGVGLVYFFHSLYLEYKFFPDVVLCLLLSVLGYLSLKPSLLSYFVLTFSKDHQLTIERPFYLFRLFENAIQNLTIDLKEVEKILIVIPERPSAPANYLFFMKENTGKALLLLYFDEKEGEQIKKRLKASKVRFAKENITDINYDSMIGVSTLH
jgi:hypothetical protein